MERERKITKIETVTDTVLHQVFGDSYPDSEVSEKNGEVSIWFKVNGHLGFATDEELEMIEPEYRMALLPLTQKLETMMSINKINFKPETWNFGDERRVISALDVFIQGRLYQEEER